MSQNIEVLNTKLSTARDALNTALADGEDTTEARYAIAFIEQEIAALERAERERQAEESRAAAAEIERAAAEVASQAHAAVEAATTVEGLAELAGERLPTMVRNPAIDHAAAAVARARVDLERAEDEYRPHAAKVVKLQQRTREKRASIDAITKRRLDGDERDGDAAELDMHRNDATALEQLLGEAKNAAAAQDRRSAARAALTNAETAVAHQQRLATLASTKARAELAERLLIAAVNNARAAEKAVGAVRPAFCYAASPELRQLVIGVR